jgi:hypothetical protein
MKVRWYDGRNVVGNAIGYAEHAEKEHFDQCRKCRQFVDKRELRDVISHETDHKPKPHIPGIRGKRIS